MSNYKINIETVYPDVAIKKQQIKHLVNTVLAKEAVAKAEINIIFVDDKYITRLNQEFLNKDTTTDVICFNLDVENDTQKEGEVYANIEQIIRQAGDFSVPFKDELYRVVIHGLLHLIGYNDQTIEQKQIMTEKEDYYLVVLECNF